MHVVLYDGVCGLCNGFVRFVLRRDNKDVFRFLALQSPKAQEILQRLHRAAQTQDSVLIVGHYDTPSERVFDRSAAVLFVLNEMGGVWRLARVFTIFPRVFLDVCYNFVAQHRYRWFGKYETCALPAPGYRAKFLDSQEP